MPKAERTQVNSVVPDQSPLRAASNQSQHCLHKIYINFFKKIVKYKYTTMLQIRRGNMDNLGIFTHISPFKNIL